jgi:ribokinase
MAHGRIAVIGSSMTDLVTYVTRMPERGETLEAPEFFEARGGKGANQAVAAAKLGSDVLFAGKIGDDVFGTATIDNFKAYGIDTRHIGVVPGVASGVAPIFVEPSGENRILIVTGANAHLTPADVDRARDDLAGCGAIVLQLEVPLETVYRAVALGAELGVPVIVNPAPATDKLDLARLRGAAFVIPNQTELALLSGRPCTTADEAALAAQVLLAAGIATVIVTLGAAGALVVTPNESRMHTAAPVAAIDTTGAGDAFIGCFAHTLVAGGDVHAAVAAAVAYASDSVTRKGSQMSFGGRTR